MFEHLFVRQQTLAQLEFPGALHQFQYRFVPGKLCCWPPGLNARMIGMIGFT